MNIHYLQHVPFEGPGNIEDWARRRRHALGANRLHGDEWLPRVKDIEMLAVMGGPMNDYEQARYSWLTKEKRFIESVIAAGGHVLGVCLGAQFVTDVLGARVYPCADKAIGWFPIEITAAASAGHLFAGFPRRLEAFHWHGARYA